jgi:hypothetical protein
VSRIVDGCWACGTIHQAPALEMLRDVAESRKLYGLVLEFERLIRKRSYEPRRRTGFWDIDPLTGQNRANRLGRPQ